ncbi:hypothetical protein LTR94_027062, partial [Friedmanniomyces endolithicus]
MKLAADRLDQLGVAWEAKVVSAHRTPQRLYDFATTAKDNGFKVIIAGAGGAAHLPGMAASMTDLPVLGVPVQSKALKGLDSLLSIVQMPGGVPVATLAIGEAGAANAGILAAQILALSDTSVAERLSAFRAAQTESVAETLPLPPGSTLGILGGGQLGRMLSQAASRLGFDVVILDPQPDCPAARVSRAQITAPYDDPDALQALGRLCDVVTFEFENVPAASVETLAEAGALVAPGPTALAVGQDRVDEKTYLNAVDAPTVAFAAVATLDDLTNAIERLGLPALLKTRREGYDGKGQVWIRD